MLLLRTLLIIKWATGPDGRTKCSDHYRQIIWNIWRLPKRANSEQGSIVDVIMRLLPTWIGYIREWST